MAQQGSSLFTAQSQLVTLFHARLGSTCAVNYDGPMVATDVTSDMGDLDAIWFDDVDNIHDVAVIVAQPLWIDETYTIKTIIQVIRTTTSGTQDVVDQRACEILGEVLGAISADPSIGLSTHSKDFLMFKCLPKGWHYKRGGMPSGPGHGGRFELDLEVTARLQLS